MERVKRRADTDARVGAVFVAADAEPLIARLAAADIAFARVTDMAALGRHPHLRRITVDLPSGSVSCPAPAVVQAGESRRYGPVPALGAHTAKVRAEFMPVAAAGE